MCTCFIFILVLWRAGWLMCIVLFVSSGLQPRNWNRLLCAPDGKSHGESIRERGESQLSSLQGQCLNCILRIIGVTWSSNHIVSLRMSQAWWRWPVIYCGAHLLILNHPLLCCWFNFWLMCALYRSHTRLPPVGEEILHPATLTLAWLRQSWTGRLNLT